MNKSVSTLIGAVGAIVLIGVAMANTLEEDKQFTVKKGGTLYLVSDAGKLDISSHDKDSVEVNVQKVGGGAENFKVSFEQSGDDVRITGERDGARNWFQQLNVRYVVKVPKHYNLDLKTGGGSIDISKIKGEVAARTSGGSINLGSIEGDVAVKTSGGSIDIEEVDGNLDARTSGGSIRATLSSQLTKDCRLSTSGGSVTAFLNPDLQANLIAKTSGGQVRTDFKIDGVVSKRKIEGLINGGGPELVIKTSGGSVNVRKL